MSKLFSSKMRIWIDGYEANVPQRLGSSQIAFELLKHLEKLDQKNDYSILLPSPPMDDLPKTREGWRYKILKPAKLWTRIALPLALYSSRKKPDLIFSPTHYIPRFSPVKRLVTIFDLSFIHFPEMFNKKDLWQLKNWTKFSVKNADFIITISKNTRDDIIKEYGVNKNKISLAYPGFDESAFHKIFDRNKIKKIQSKYKTGSNYILYIGTIQPRKNLIRLIEAFSRIVSSVKGQESTKKQSRFSTLATSNLKLVIVGKTTGLGRQAWMFEETLEAPKKFGVEDEVILTGFVPTKDLPYLINGAMAFIQPSLYEGFGIPVVEAMVCGVPVLVSNTSSLPEVVGKAGIMFDPYSVTQIEQAIRTVLSDKKIRDKYAKLSLKQAKKFSWRKMARVVLDVFEKQIGENKQ